jgi:Undecaprenyl-phosphate galactose phosphotransferase WbaP
MAIPSPAIIAPTGLRLAARASAADRGHCSPAAAATLMALGDLCAVALSLSACVLARRVAGGHFSFSLYIGLWPVLALFPAAYALFGLYPGIVSNVVSEIRRTAAASTVVFLVLAVLTFLMRVADLYSRLVFLMAWGIALAAVPLTRALVRSLFAKEPWWGYPVVVFGDGDVALKLLHRLRRTPRHGLRPVAIVARGYPEGASIDGVPVFERLGQAGLDRRRLGPSRGLVVVSGTGGHELVDALHSHSTLLPRLLMVPGLDEVSSLDIEAKDVCHSLMLESLNRLLLPWPQAVKRALDVVCTVALGVVALPFAAVIAVIVRLESPGPALYGHARIGRDGRRFIVWKFRTMTLDADRVLESHLREHPELAAEWRLTQKLKRDPRVTRFGRFLRRLSLDELPQLWNILRGDMSLVGPRPIVTGEIEKYREAYASYSRVRPGLTGLWQVSGRNDVTFDERVGLDAYYVRNWSPWLDIYVLARTVSVVLTRAGAY